MRLFSIAWQAVVRKPVRALLTAFSLILGVLALTCVAAAQGAMNDAVVRTALLADGPQETSQVTFQQIPNPLGVARNYETILHRTSPDTARTAITVTTNNVRLASQQHTDPSQEVLIVDPSIRSIHPYELQEGAWLSENPNTLAIEVVLNTIAAQNGYPNTWQLYWGNSGQHMTARTIGIIDDASSLPQIYINLRQQGPWLEFHDTTTVAMEVHVPGLNHDNISSLLLQTQTLTNQGTQLQNIQRKDTISAHTAALNTVAKVFFAVALMSLIVGAVGMLNIGLATVKERSDELCLRRAFGAHRWHIFAIMILEAQILAWIAGAIAVATTYIMIPTALEYFGNQITEPAFPLRAIFIGLLAGSTAALIGSLTPAVKAVNVPIASIMRG